MDPTLECPTCNAPLREVQDRLECPEQHVYSPLEFAQWTNSAAVLALWRAIRALEDDAAGLEWLAARETTEPARAQARRAEAAGARRAAADLRASALDAQRRLTSLGDGSVVESDRQ